MGRATILWFVQMRSLGCSPCTPLTLQQQQQDSRSISQSLKVASQGANADLEPFKELISRIITEDSSFRTSHHPSLIFQSPKMCLVATNFFSESSSIDTAVDAFTSANGALSRIARPGWCWW